MTAIALSLIYLLYLSLICQSFIIYDSVAYQTLGAQLLDKGFLWYLKTGPHREPLYPALVALSLHLAKAFSLEAAWVLKILQITLLAFTQLMVLFILRRLGARPWLAGAAVLYTGVSPALSNSALWVYSEIVAMPLVLAAVWWLAQAWQGIFKKSWNRNMLNGISLGLTCTLLTFVKAIFEAIVPVLMLPFLFLCFDLRRSQPMLRKAILVLACWAAVFYVPLTAYKVANKVFNGHYTFTDRGAWALYGNAMRRSEPLTAAKIKAAIVYAVNPHWCYTVDTKEACDFWSYLPSDTYGYTKLQSLQAQGMPEENIYRTMAGLAMDQIRAHPVQYLFLSGIESLKMLFWETCRAGQVTYPGWLERIHAGRFLEPVLVALTSFLSLMAFISLSRTLWKRRRELLNPSQSFAHSLLLFAWTLIVVYTLAHSLFFVLQRYSLPLAPLWIVLIASSMDSWINKTRGPRGGGQ